MPFIPLNVGAMATRTGGVALQVHLFGCAGGGVIGGFPQGAQGVFEQAAGGTVFLDEIGEITPDATAMLLRSLQLKTDNTGQSYHEVAAVGEVNPRRVPPFRLICATDQLLPVQVRSRKFDDALYWRIAEEEIHLPPLRERTTDIMLLAEKFFQYQGGMGSS